MPEDYKTDHMTIRMPSDVRRVVAEQAQREDRTISGLVRVMIKEGLEKRDTVVPAMPDSAFD